MQEMEIELIEPPLILNMKEFQYSENFDPTTALDVSTNIFNVPDHFFNTGEKLTYAAGSSFSGVTATSIQTGGSNIPTTVYAIKSGSDEFKLATTRNNAL